MELVAESRVWGFSFSRVVTGGGGRPTDRPTDTRYNIIRRYLYIISTPDGGDCTGDNRTNIPAAGILGVFGKSNREKKRKNNDTEKSGVNRSAIGMQIGVGDEENVIMIVQYNNNTYGGYPTR